MRDWKSCDGLVIGGSAHGQQMDPRSRGPVVHFPKRRPLRAIDYRADIGPDAMEPMELETYRAHPFRSGHGSMVLYFPDHVTDEGGLAYLINTALRAPREE